MNEMNAFVIWIQSLQSENSIFLSKVFLFFSEHDSLKWTVGVFFCCYRGVLLKDCRLENRRCRSGAFLPLFPSPDFLWVFWNSLALCGLSTKLLSARPWIAWLQRLAGPPTKAQTVREDTFTTVGKTGTRSFSQQPCCHTHFAPQQLRGTGN